MNDPGQPHITIPLYNIPSLSLCQADYGTFWAKEISATEWSESLGMVADVIKITCPDILGSETTAIFPTPWG